MGKVFKNQLSKIDKELVKKDLKEFVSVRLDKSTKYYLEEIEEIKNYISSRSPIKVMRAINRVNKKGGL